MILNHEVSGGFAQRSGFEMGRPGLELKEPVNGSAASREEGLLSRECVHSGGTWLLAQSR